jgi:hypothetical protein
MCFVLVNDVVMRNQQGTFAIFCNAMTLAVKT